MLPTEHRLRASPDFAHVMRTGRRAGRGCLVVHLAPARIAGSRELHPESVGFGSHQPRFGLVVGKSVGNSVVRNQVSRRLRAQLAARVDRIPAGVDVVVRAQPGAATASSTQLGADIDSALSRLLRSQSKSERS